MDGRKAYLEKFEKGTTAWDLALMLSHVGLAGVDPEALGGNHPDAVQLARIWRGLPNTDPETDPNPETANPKTAKKITSEKTTNKLAQALDRVEPRAPGETLNPIEKARYYRAYMDKHGLSAAAAAKRLGVSRSEIYNHIRTLGLPDDVLDHVIEGRLSLGHAKALANMRDPSAVARLAIRRQLSVRQTETMARRLRHVLPNGRLTHDTAIPHTYLAEGLMEDALGLKVSFRDRAGKGEISIRYNSPDEARRIVDRLTATYFGLGPQDIQGKDKRKDKKEPDPERARFGWSEEMWAEHGWRADDEGAIEMPEDYFEEGDIWLTEEE